MVLETERLLLRTLETCDAPAMTVLLNDPAINNMMDDYPYPYTEGDAQRVIHWAQDALGAGNGWGLAILRKVDRLFLGALFLKLYTPVPEIGYWVGRAFWGQGYVTEAARGIVRYAFDELGLGKIAAYCLVQNVASQRVLEKLGMRYVSREEYPVPHSPRVDVLLYWELQREDWKS
ncbi:MAG: GNAT family N-acetyltransferase [Chloroflexi bacterium]|nr:GNAT family N-acetyltransferase [Chloroflexota bacterium]